MPLLERLNPQAVSALARLADTAGGALDFMGGRAGRRVVGDGVGVRWRSLAGPRTISPRCNPALQGLAVRARAPAGRPARARRWTRFT